MKIVGLVFEKKNEKPKFFCPVCNKDYASESTLEKHIKEKHPDYVPNPSGADA